MTKDDNTEPFIITSAQSRKRSKVSRACDTCRKKKIKCNAEYSSSLKEITKKCDNCIKNQVECLFSRTPLKRGPSKGYIRDLEEKLEISNNSKTHIILPPIGKTASSDSLTNSNVTPSVGKILPMNPTSPVVSLSSSPKIQGPFWKVPYEMPHRNEVTHEPMRRSSIDSISSNSTNNSRTSRLPSLKSVSDQNSVSDSDDEYYSSMSEKHSRRLSASLSPRNSVSSLASINGRIKRVNISPSPSSTSPGLSQPQPQPPFSLPNINVNYIPPPMIPNIHINNQIPPLNQLYQVRPIHKLQLLDNLKVYYSKFHLNFPILPFNETYIEHIIEIYDNSLHDQFRFIVDIFNQSLYHVINYQSLQINDSIQLVLKVVSMYPFNNYGIQLNDDFLVLFFASLILVNYAILLSGNTYSLGLSLSHSIFNDFKVLENFRNCLESKEINELYFDNIKLILPKLYYCLIIIDRYYSLSLGTQKSVHGNFDVLYQHGNFLVPINFNSENNFNGCSFFRNVHLVNSLINLRDAHFFNSQAELDPIDFKCGAKSDTVFKHFSIIAKDKHELFDFLVQVYKLFNHNVTDGFVDMLNDHILKLVRLIKTLTQDLLSLSSFIVVVDKTEIISPVLNLILFQSIKLIKISKLIIDTLCNYVKNETLSTIMNINNDLSMTFNKFHSQIPNCLLSGTAIQLMKVKLTNYNLNFGDIASTGVSNILNWKFDFLKVILPFVEREDVDGWL